MGFVTIWVTTSMTSASAPLPRKACRLCAREAELLVSISMPCGEGAGRTVRQSDATAREAEVLVSSSMPCTGRAGIFRAHRVALWYHNMQWGRRLWSSSKGSLGYLNALQGKSASALPLSCCGGHWQLCALLVEACNWAAHGLSRRSVQHGSRLLTLLSQVKPKSLHQGTADMNKLQGSSATALFHAARLHAHSFGANSRTSCSLQYAAQQEGIGTPCPQLIVPSSARSPAYAAQQAHQRVRSWANQEMHDLLCAYAACRVRLADVSSLYSSLGWLLNSMPTRLQQGAYQCLARAWQVY